MKREIISKFKERPKTKTAWWAMVLGLATIFIGPTLGIFGAVVRPFLDTITNENIGIAVGTSLAFLTLALSISALILGVRAYKTGERSWVLWIGFVPAIFAGVFWVSLIIGEFFYSSLILSPD